MGQAIEIKSTFPGIEDSECQDALRKNFKIVQKIIFTTDSSLSQTFNFSTDPETTEVAFRVKYSDAMFTKSVSAFAVVVTEANRIFLTTAALKIAHCD